MKKLESNLKNMVLSLLLIAVVAAALLALVNSLTTHTIAQIEIKARQDAIRSVLVGESDAELRIDAPQTRGESELYRAYAPDGKLVGTAVSAPDHNAFGGDITVMVGFAPDGTILGYELLKHSETPGLGAQADAWFKQAAGQAKEQSGVVDVLFGKSSAGGNHNIIGMNPGRDNMTVSKDGGQVDAITASTITSRAFLRAVQAAYDALDVEP